MIDALEEQGFRVIKKIGEGGYAQVFAVEWNRYPNKVFAAKVLSVDNPDIAKSYSDELLLLKQLEHKNIIHVYHHFSSSKQLILIIEYCKNGSLREHIKMYGPMPTCEFKEVARQCLVALSACHHQRISHRDIKPSNFLINEDNRIILGDFGIAEKNFDDKTRSFKGSRMYSPPEFFLKAPYDPIKGDIWSLGITFYYLLTGTVPWDCMSGTELIDQIKFGTLNYSNKIGFREKELLSSMIRKNPENRLSCDQLLNSAYFRKESNAPKWKAIPIHDDIKMKKISKILSLGTLPKGFTCNVVPTFTCRRSENDISIL